MSSPTFSPPARADRTPAEESLLALLIPRAPSPSPVPARPPYARPVLTVSPRARSPRPMSKSKTTRRPRAVDTDGNDADESEAEHCALDALVERSRRLERPALARRIFSAPPARLGSRSRQSLFLVHFTQHSRQTVQPLHEPGPASPPRRPSPWPYALDSSVPDCPAHEALTLPLLTPSTPVVRARDYAQSVPSTPAAAGAPTQPHAPASSPRVVRGRPRAPTAIPPAYHAMPAAHLPSSPVSMSRSPQPQPPSPRPIPHRSPRAPPTSPLAHPPSPISSPHSLLSLRLDDGPAHPAGPPALPTGRAGASPLFAADPAPPRALAAWPRASRPIALTPPDSPVKPRSAFDVVKASERLRGLEGRVCFDELGVSADMSARDSDDDEQQVLPPQGDAQHVEAQEMNGGKRRKRPRAGRRWTLW